MSLLHTLFTTCNYGPERCWQRPVAANMDIIATGTTSLPFSIPTPFPLLFHLVKTVSLITIPIIILPPQKKPRSLILKEKEKKKKKTTPPLPSSLSLPLHHSSRPSPLPSLPTLPPLPILPLLPPALNKPILTIIGLYLPILSCECQSSSTIVFLWC